MFETPKRNPDSQLGMHIRDQFSIPVERYDVLADHASHVLEQLLSTNDEPSLSKCEALEKITSICENSNEVAVCAYILGEYFGERTENKFRSLLQEAGIL